MAMNKLGGYLEMERWLRDRGVKYTKKVKPDVVYYELDQCPFNASHRAPDSAFTLSAKGKPGFKCFHASCQEHNWQTAAAKIGKPRAEHYRHTVSGISSSSSPDDRGIQEFEGMHSREFFEKVYTLEYLVGGVIVTGQNFMFGGPEKCLKTNISVDLMLSVGSGAPFLGHFPVGEAKPCALFTGESGARTIQDVAKRVAESRGLNPAETNCLWHFTLPQISNKRHLRGLEKLIRDDGLKLMLVDPAYLCTLGGDTKKVNASNLMEMGPLLSDFGAVAGETDCVLGLVHHFKKQGKDAKYTRPGLEDLSHSGFSAFARQWLLVNKRAPYLRDQGLHELYMCVGGSAGHGGDYVLDVDEGDPYDHVHGRRWLPSVSELREWESDREAGEVASRNVDQKQAEPRVLSAVNSADKAISLGRIRERSGVSDAKILRRVIDDLVAAGALVVQLRGNTTEYTVPGHPCEKVKK